MAFQIVVPEPKWFSEPLLAEIAIYKESAEETRALCSLAVGAEEHDGCTLLFPGSVCKIIINKDMDWRMYGAVLHHETAHCHGWPADHPVE